jgi:phosphate uptake regulator
VGYNTIVVYSQNKIPEECLSAIRNTTLRLIGLSIMDEEPHKVTLQCSVDALSTPLITMMRRLFSLTMKMYSKVLEGLISLDPSLAQEVISREYEADMLYWLILRIIGYSQRDMKIAERIGVHEPVYLLGYRVIIKYLESVADHLESAASYLLALIKLYKKRDEKALRAVHHIGESALRILSDAFESLVMEDLKKADKAIKEKEKLEEEEGQIVSRILSKIENPQVAAYVRGISRDFYLISDYGASIAHVAINMYVGKPSKIIMPVKSEEAMGLAPTGI